MVSEYDAGREMDRHEELLPPRWKTVPCSTCGAAAGEQCGKRPLGMPWGWDHVAPHVARKRAVGLVPPLRRRNRDYFTPREMAILGEDPSL